MLGELYRQALEAQGYTVVLNRNIGPTEVTIPALESGRLDMYPEYLDTWDSSVAGIQAVVPHVARRLPRRPALRARARPRAAQPDAVQRHRRDRRDARLRGRERPLVAARPAQGRDRADARSAAAVPAEPDRAAGDRAGLRRSCPPRSSRSTSARSTRRSTRARCRPPTSTRPTGSSPSGDYTLLRDPAQRVRLGQRRPGRLGQGPRTPRARRSPTTIDRVSALLTTPVMRRAERRGRRLTARTRRSSPSSSSQEHGLLPPGTLAERMRSAALGATTARAEPARAALRQRELVDLDAPPAISTRTSTSWAIRSPAAIVERRVAVGVQQQHPDLAAVAGVDQPGRVDERDPVPRGEPRARQHEPGLAVGDLDRDAGAAPTARSPGVEHAVLERVQVEAGVAGIGPGRQLRARRRGADPEAVIRAGR